MFTARVSWLLVGLVALAAFAAANPGRHHHDPCAVGRDHWTWGASEGEELDAEAMQVSWKSGGPRGSRSDAKITTPRLPHALNCTTNRRCM